MIKAFLMFVGSNALWDKMVDYFGSTETVVEATVILLGLFLLVKFFKEIIGFVVIAFILWAIFH
jgi:hypothetical protein